MTIEASKSNDLSPKEEIQKINNRLDKYRRKLAGAQERGDQAIIAQFKREITTLEKRLAKTKGKQNRQLSSKGKDVKSLPFSRALSKTEQADMGKLKKSVKGLVVVHPMTALGREMGLKEMTGFAPAEF